MTDEAVEAAARAEFDHDTSGSTLWPLTGAWDETVTWTRQVYAKRAAAGVAAAAPYIAAKALRDAARELTRDCDRRCTERDCRDHAVWLIERADDIERAARSAGKDGTDGDH